MVLGMVWTKLTAASRLSAASLALAVGAMGLYATWQATLSVDASCRDLRTSILSMLEGNVDDGTRHARVHKDLTEFERSCALRDPEAKAVFSAVDRTILFTGTSDAERAEARPVHFVPPPPPVLGRRWPGLVPPPDESRRRPFGT
jgi:hypothetical protein